MRFHYDPVLQILGNKRKKKSLLYDMNIKNLLNTLLDVPLYFYFSFITQFRLTKNYVCLMVHKHDQGAVMKMKFLPQVVQTLEQSWQLESQTNRTDRWTLDRYDSNLQSRN